MFITDLTVTISGVVTIWGLHKNRNIKSKTEKSFYTTYDNVFIICLGNIQSQYNFALKYFSVMSMYRTTIRFTALFNSLLPKIVTIPFNSMKYSSEYMLMFPLQESCIFEIHNIKL